MKINRVLFAALAFLLVTASAFAVSGSEKTQRKAVQTDIEAQPSGLVPRISPETHPINSASTFEESTPDENSSNLVTPAEETPSRAPEMTKGLTKKERRSMRKHARNAAFKSLFKRNKGHKRVPKDKTDADVNLVLLVILALLLPPLAVYLALGIGTEFWIDLILTLLLWLPGVIFALVVILMN